MLPRLKTDVPGPKSRALARRLRMVENPNVTFIAPDGAFPVFWESGDGCLITDVDGNRLLDLTAAFGVMAVGHANPRVAAAVAEQAARLTHGMGDVHPTRLKVALLERLSTLTPGDLGHTILGQNGGDAVEAAIKSARLFTGKPGVLAFSGGYHGLTFGALAVTARADFKEPFSGQVPPFAVHTPFGDLEAAADLLTRCTDIGAVIVEPIQGRGGIVVPPAGFLAELRDLCDAAGVLLIADEIFTGWGRTGDLFAGQRENVLPDILCVGKAMGGGFPISACLMRPQIAAAWGESRGEALHTSTFLGSPLGCAAALAAIGEIIENDLPGKANTSGAEFRASLEQLAAQFPDKIVAVRGRGLMLGVQLASRSLALRLVGDLLGRGVIVLPAGDGDIIEFTPPLTISSAQITWAVETVGNALTELPPC